MTLRNLLMRGAAVAFAPEGDGTGTGAGGTPAVPPAGSWTDGLADNVKGWLQTRGLDAKTPAEALAAAHAEAAKAAEFNGVPADKLIRLPDGPTDEAGLKAFREKLGVPADAKGYDFTGLKKADGSEVDQAFKDFAANAALAVGIPKDKAAEFANLILKREADAATSAAADREAALISAKAELAKEWGQNQEAHLFVAKQAALKLGVTPEAVAALEAQIGYAAVMKMFQKVGVALGEDKFVANPNPNSTGMWTREQAVERKAELMRDDAWVDRYMKGDVAANREMTALLTTITAE